VGPSVVRWGKAVLRLDSTRGRAWLEHEVGEDPDKWVPAVSERGGKERGKLGRGPRGEGSTSRLGRTVRGKVKEKKDRLGWAVWKKKREGKEKERMGMAVSLGS
jgi:hypothetical protein